MDGGALRIFLIIIAYACRDSATFYTQIDFASHEARSLPERLKDEPLPEVRLIASPCEICIQPGLMPVPSSSLAVSSAPRRILGIPSSGFFIRFQLDFSV